MPHQASLVSDGKLGRDVDWFRVSDRKSRRNHGTSYDEVQRADQIGATTAGEAYLDVTAERPLERPVVAAARVWSETPVPDEPPVSGSESRFVSSDQAYSPARRAQDMPTEIPGQANLDVMALRESMVLIEGQLDRLGERFYAVLFANYPALRAMFPAGLDAQQSRLVSALVRIVGSASNARQLVTYLESLGRDHRKFGVIAQHYAPLGMALISALRTVVGHAWSSRYERAWVQAYDLVSETMVNAAERDSQVNPPWWDAEVVVHRRVLDDLAVILARPHTDYPYRPGQYCYIMTPRRTNLWRAYSFASAPREDGLLEFHVRAVGAGWVSSALVWRTEPGDILRLGAPQGKEMANPAGNRDLLSICGGTGVAPILAGVQDLAHQHSDLRVHVFYAGRDRDSLYALPHLETLGMKYRRLTVVPVISPEETIDRSPDVMGNIVAAYGDWHEHNVFVAGPSTMVSAAVDRLRQGGVPERQIHWDDYGI